MSGYFDEHSMFRRIHRERAVAPRSAHQRLLASASAAKLSLCLRALVSMP
jgi:hypothetical protein